MLIYNSVFDPYHCVFRAVRMLRNAPANGIEYERWRILDFYLVFPPLLRDFSFPEEYKALRRTLPSRDGKYQNVSDPKRIFFRMEPIQYAAVAFLVSHNIVLGDILLDKRRLVWNETACPVALRKMAEDLDGDPILKLLRGPFIAIDLYGKSGLKARSDLFQYRYDVPQNRR